jgi:hypothetical protein
MCVSVTSDATVLGDICAAVGVGETARILCDDVGYSAGTCDDVSQQAAAAFATCAEVTAIVNGMPAAQGLCPTLSTMTTEADCASWGANDGPAIALGSQAIRGLQPTIASGQTSQHA